MYDAEDRRVCADAERQRQNGHCGEPRILAHHTECVMAVARQDLPMFAGSCREYSGYGFFPELERAEEAASSLHVALLLAEDAFHLAFVIRTKIEWQHT